MRREEKMSAKPWDWKGKLDRDGKRRRDKDDGYRYDKDDDRRRRRCK